MPRNLNVAIALLLSLLLISSAHAFCGFYVAKADAKLFNQASKVVITRSGERTVLTMANDYQGDLREFAIVFPVPVVLQRDDVRIANTKNIEHVDRYSAPRLVEYFDRDPCAPIEYADDFFGADFFSAPSGGGGGAPVPPAKKTHGVKIEASYQVGEYDILVLSGEQSDGLLAWLTENGYRVPAAAKPILGTYLKQKMKFFVAKVNLQAQADSGYSYLRPLQVSYTAKKFALPIRLGTVNAKGDQELFAYILTENGRAECTNYKTSKIETNTNIPTYVKDNFGAFYKTLFARAVAKNPSNLVLEYSWGMGSCDPCAADPLSDAQLIDLGCHWLENKAKDDPQPERTFFLGKDHTYITRLHLRYNAKTFPEDLQFQLTSDKARFQGRYVLNTPFRVKKKCPELGRYYRTVNKRWKEEVATMVRITGEAEDAIWKKHAVPYQITKYDTDLYRIIRNTK